MPQNLSVSSQIIRQFSQPILAPFLYHRSTGLVVLGVVAAHGGLVMAGWPGWPCPVRTTLGIPCPGCGLSRALAALVSGDWQTSLTYHAFAPLFLAGIILIGAATLLPSAPRQRLIGWVEHTERYSGFMALFLIGLVFYWLARLLFFGPAFFNLILG